MTTDQVGADRELTLHDHWPGVPTGKYVITAEHTAEGTADGKKFKQTFTGSRTLYVRGPRFVLTPEQVHACYPAPGAAGAFADDLPHAVLAPAVLPWERVLDKGRPEVPWLALLVLHEKDLPVDPATGRADQTRSVKELLPGAGHVQPPKVLLPALTEEQDPKHPESCRTVDVPADCFTDVLPRFDELPLLSHVRRVSGTGGGDHAVLLANRLPRTAGRYTAHVVSLEGFTAKQLSGGSPLMPDGKPAEKVRLVSLWSWDFAVSGTAAPSFLSVAKQVAANSAGRLPLRLPDGSTGKTAVSKRLADGFVPVGHQLPDGARTYAWYRGPFTPVVPHSLPVDATTLTSEAEALIYSQAHGVFDVGYASAFALGKAITLANTDLARSLGEVRAAATTAAQELAKRLARGLDINTGRVQAKSFGAPAAHPGRLATAAFARLATDGPLLAEPPAPAADPGAATRKPDAPTLQPVVDATTGPHAQAAVRTVVAQYLDRVTGAGLDPARLLAAVPFDHLVPDPGLLPPESVRLFHVDPAWLRALTAGAGSLGLCTSLDLALHDEVTKQVLAASAPPAAGLLLRSALCRDWPGLQVVARRNKGAEDVLSGAPRFLAADLLLAFFTAAPDSVVLRQPSQVLHFGLDGTDLIKLRYARPEDGEVGSSMARDFTGVPLRQPKNPARTREVLDTGRLRAAVKDRLCESPPRWDSATALPPGVLGLQLLNSQCQLVIEAAK
ncbi:hypothetical protein [Kitasatospora sp. CB02891]|uniref:hypothetical protein n=1 Tax=Kitasatospora sp. CB02891 TaxID=2020329 RepID=UPI000C2750B4|nr:hypothetical protein [Kitasatospora sp. CB02891]PJN27777.1 hypothetical protein CG736_06075 [Kitasatospora sp. CB02891]